MTISAKSRYAVRALVELAERSSVNGGRPVRLSDIASSRGIPPQFLEQVFAALRRAGVLRSRRGANGGYAFAREPQSVTVLDVVAALDGLDGPAACTTGDCTEVRACAAASVWAETREAMERVLRTTTIASLADRERTAAAANGAVMYHI